MCRIKSGRFDVTATAFTGFVESLAEKRLVKVAAFSEQRLLKYRLDKNPSVKISSGIL